MGGTGRIGGEACGRSEWTSDSSLACTTPAGQGHQDLVSVLVGGQVPYRRSALLPRVRYCATRVLRGVLYESATGLRERCRVCGTELRERYGVGGSEVSRGMGGQESKQTDATPTFAYTGLAITAVRPDFGPTSGGTEVLLPLLSSLSSFFLVFSFSFAGRLEEGRVWCVRACGGGEALRVEVGGR